MPVVSTSPTRSAPWYRHRWPWLLMAGPVAVIIAGLVTAWVAFTGADALVVDDYYKQGKAINQDLRRDRMAETLGLQLTLRYDAANDKLIGQLSGAQAAVPLVLQLIHPTMPGKDQRYTLVPDSKGVFELALPLLERAHWQIQLEDTKAQWRLHGHWDWPQQKKISIQPGVSGEQDAT